MAQNWNNILSYCKLELGAPLNMIEMSDDEIITALKEHVLSYFSQYSPYMKYCYINGSNHIPVKTAAQPRFMYRIPVEPGEQIIDVSDVYPAQSSVLTEDFGLTVFNHFGAIDAVIANSYIDAIKSLGVRNTWEFVAPDKIIMDTEFTGDGAVVAYYVPHQELSTIPPDLYSLVFKKLCIGKVMVWLAARRSKYENLATPFGQLPINWQMLKDDGQKLLDEANQFLTALPPDKLVEISL